MKHFCLAIALAAAGHTAAGTKTKESLLEQSQSAFRLWPDTSVEGRSSSFLQRSSALDDPPLATLLAGAHWPAKDSYDQTFTSVTSGASADPCSAPLLGRARLSPYGLGAHLNQFANEVSLAIYSGKPMALCAPPHVRDMWARYFQDPGFAKCDSCDWGQGPRAYKEMGMDISRGNDHEQVGDIKHYLYQKLFTLQPDMQSAVDTGVSSLGLDSVYIGVHIRRGDKTQEVRNTDVDKYAKAAKQLCSQLGASTIFLASDDAEAKGMLQEKLGSSYKIVEQPRLPAEDYTFRGDASRYDHPPLGVEDEEKSVFIDVSALVHSAGFVGTASSNIGRLVYFQREPEAPAVAVDVEGSDGFLFMTR